MINSLSKNHANMKTHNERQPHGHHPHQFKSASCNMPTVKKPAPNQSKASHKISYLQHRGIEKGN